MRWGVCCRRIGHFDQADISPRLARELLPDHVAPRRSVRGRVLLRRCGAVGHCRGCKQRNQSNMSPAENKFGHSKLCSFGRPLPYEELADRRKVRSLTPVSLRCTEMARGPLWVRSGHSVRSRPCPLCPRKWTSPNIIVMSALCQKQTFRAAIRNVVIRLPRQRDRAAPAARRGLGLWQF